MCDRKLESFDPGLYADVYDSALERGLEGDRNAIMRLPNPNDALFASRRASPRRSKSPKRKSPKAKSPKRKTTKRKTKAKSPKRSKSPNRR